MTMQMVCETGKVSHKSTLTTNQQQKCFKSWKKTLTASFGKLEDGTYCFQFNGKHHLCAHPLPSAGFVFLMRQMVKNRPQLHVYQATTDGHLTLILCVLLENLNEFISLEESIRRCLQVYSFVVYVENKLRHLHVSANFLCLTTDVNNFKVVQIQQLDKGTIRYSEARLDPDKPKNTSISIVFDSKSTIECSTEHASHIRKLLHCYMKPDAFIIESSISQNIYQADVPSQIAEYDDIDSTSNTVVCNNSMPSAPNRRVKEDAHSNYNFPTSPPPPLPPRTYDQYITPIVRNNTTADYVNTEKGTKNPEKNAEDSKNSAYTKLLPYKKLPTLYCKLSNDSFESFKTFEYNPTKFDQGQKRTLDLCVAIYAPKEPLLTDIWCVSIVFLRSNDDPAFKTVLERQHVSNNELLKSGPVKVSSDVKCQLNMLERISENFKLLSDKEQHIAFHSLSEISTLAYIMYEVYISYEADDLTKDRQFFATFKITSVASHNDPATLAIQGKFKAALHPDSNHRSSPMSPTAVQPTPLPITGFQLSERTRQMICDKLDSDGFHNWRSLAAEFALAHDVVERIQREKYPTETLLTHYERTSPEQCTKEFLKKALEAMQRNDILLAMEHN